MLAYCLGSCVNLQNDQAVNYSELLKTKAKTVFYTFICSIYVTKLVKKNFLLRDTLSN